MILPAFTTMLERLGIPALNAMQEATVQTYSQHPELVLLSPTGSGKTLAFLLPLVSSLNPTEKGVQALVVSPTRELALQIEQVFRLLGTGFKVNVCYGGHAFQTEVNNLSQPPAVLIGTPGRLADHLRRQTFSTDSIRRLVLDEFDKSLELGFEGDMADILSQCANLEHKLLTSATRPERLPAFVQLKAPVELNFLSQASESRLILKTVHAEGQDKAESLLRLIGYNGKRATLVFCNHRDAVERIGQLLASYGIVHGVFHGGLEQEHRERVLIKFRNGSLRLLITTDLAARGLDIPEIETVVHYQLPLTEEAFIHRNGRTARMHAEGNAYLLLAEEETLPAYLRSTPERLTIPAAWTAPEAPEWETLYIGGGKKNKINKVDIVGLLLQKGGLHKEDLGKIDIQDTVSYAAVKRDKIHAAVKQLLPEKIKKQKVKIAVAR